MANIPLAVLRIIKMAKANLLVPMHTEHKQSARVRTRLASALVTCHELQTNGSELMSITGLSQKDFASYK
jgi:hypothetical protein